MSKYDELNVHREWLGLLQPVGVVVSPPALVKLGAVPERTVGDLQVRFQETVHRPGGSAYDDDRPYVPDLPRLLTHVLGWEREDLRGEGGDGPVPDDLVVTLPNYGETLAPTWSVHASMQDGRALLLIQEIERGKALDDADKGADKTGWHASPQAKFERLLAESGVRVGLLTNGEAIRLVHTPEHQTSGHVTFPVQAMCEVPGRPILAAFHMLLREARVFSAPEGKGLHDLLAESRAYQNEVSNKLAEQVLHALWELLRGFQEADRHRGCALLPVATSEDRDHVYGGLLTGLMRLVFLLYAEDQGLLPQDEVWVRNYSVAGLYERLRDDAALHPDTMDQRYGAWAALLALFRIIHDGGGHGGIRLPARRGQLFDPNEYPFLEGRGRETKQDPDALLDAPRVSDGCLHRVLEALLVLDGERLSYRALDVEQIGSVYEAMMGYLVERMRGFALAVNLRRKGIPGFVFIDVDELLAQPAKKRDKWLQDTAGCKITGKSKKALQEATSADDVHAALERRVSDATPRVLLPGSLVLQPGEERRRSGSHYTPRELTQPIVATTLRPVLEDLGPNPTPNQILDLKVCDPAMGSGAFLVEACRQLADGLVAAWDAHDAWPVLARDDRDDREAPDYLLHAKRLVAQRCLYGVDKNLFAVNLAKLSLWLVTLARDHAFTFVDHALRHGDSLVGLTREQITRFHWDLGSSDALPLFRGVDTSTEEARHRREALEAMGDADEDGKRRALAEADAALTGARLAGDLIVAAFFATEKPKERAVRLAENRRFLDRRTSDAAACDEAVRVVERLRSASKPVPPFHWEIEFPEVFGREQSGFDAIVGNPPFAGKNTIASGAPPAYPDWLHALHEGSHGNSDLVAHFFRRAFDALRPGGAFGLIATNTVGQGDTRATGLRWICIHGGAIFAATRRRKWPGAAAVVVSVVHVAKGQRTGPAALDGRAVEVITAFLFHAGGNDNPATLRANARLSFQGSTVLGMGFTFDDTDTKGVASPIAAMHRLVAEHPANAEVIFPYIGGAEVNSSPTHAHHRYVINFGERGEEECRTRWPSLMGVIEGRVRGTRGAHSTADWWRFERLRPDLYVTIAGLERVLVNSQVSAHLQFAFAPAERVFAHTAYVFATPQHAAFAALQSRPHELWARFFGSTLEDRLRYTPSDCFETFPFPEGWRTHPRLEAAGQAYYDYRAALMVENDEGLTKTYNRFHDPEERSPKIQRLRELHDEMDRAVLDAYGWTDIRPTCEFILDYEIDAEEWGKKKKPYRYRWPDDVHDEVLGRLLELNRQRAEEERLAGKTKKPRAATPPPRRLQQPKRVAELPPDGLFGWTEEQGAGDA